jgi:cytochrome P450
MGLFSDIAGSFFAVLLSYFAFTFFRTRRSIRTLKNLHKCQNPPKYPHKDPIFGSDLYRENTANAKNSKLLEKWTSRYREYGHTFSAVIQGTPAICTVDVTNLQTITTTNFKDYGFQPVRRAATLPFLGEGVFTMDGPFWEHSRALIRPTFSKSNISNLPAFEANLQKFFALLPTDGSTIDLKPLLCKLVCFAVTLCTVSMSDVKSL